MKIGSGLWQNSGGELELYLGCTGSTIAMGLVDPSFLTPGRVGVADGDLNPLKINK